MRLASRPDSVVDHLDRQQISRLSAYFPPHLLRAGVMGKPQFLEGTVLVADLTGFSANAASLFESSGQDDHTLQALINRYFEVVLAESDHFGGSPFTFDGDAISILFIGPLHANIAIGAAQAIQNALARAKLELPSGPVSLRSNVGLTSGQLLSGSFGSPDALVYAVLGQTVTQAVQAQKLATSGQIILSESTSSALSVSLNIRPVKPGFYALVGHGAGLEATPSVSEPVKPISSGLAHFLSAHFPPALMGQILEDDTRIDRKQIAALFVNVDGLGELISSRGGDSVADLNQFFGGLRQIVDRRGGLLNKVNAYSVGDKYLVLFGLSALQCVDPIAAALETAFELQAQVNMMPFPLRQRIGFSSGFASECFLGNQQRREFTVIGRPVNEAVHLMELADWGEILAVGELGQKIQPEGWSVSPTRALIKGYVQPSKAYRFSLTGRGTTS